MPSYDPQRNRARVRPVVGDPAPVDQILSRPEPAASTVPPVSPVAHAHDHADDHADDRRHGFDARPVLVLVAATAAATVLVLRRRRGRRA